MKYRSLSVRLAAMLFLAALGAALFEYSPQEARTLAKEPEAETLKAKFGGEIQPLLKKYCLDCHSTKAKKGSLDLERFSSIDLIRKEVKPWQQSIEMLETLEMPPKEKPQPSAEERKQLIAWIRNFLDSEARANAGDPGHVPLRRLSNAEYDLTIKQLTGVDLKPTREFPADGAGGEGFTNAAEALTDISPALLTKYLNAAKSISENIVLLPDGFRFSASKTRRDWTDESIASMRQFYSQFTPDGKLPVRPYVAATIKYREAISNGSKTIDQVAATEKLNAKYLGILWNTLNSRPTSYPLNDIAAVWAKSSEKDIDGLVGEISAWQSVVWKFVQVGSYRYGATHRQVANDPATTPAQTLRTTIKPAPGQNEIVLYLVANERRADGQQGFAIWNRPRFEGPGKAPLLLKDYETFGPAYELDYPSLFTATAKYLKAAAEHAKDPKRTPELLATAYQLDVAYLKRWIDSLDLSSSGGTTDPFKAGTPITPIALSLLAEKTPTDGESVVRGWKAKGTDLPIAIGNGSDQLQRVPGTLPAHRVAVHPLPNELVAVTWKSPVSGLFRISPMIKHAHPVCGNGVGWSLEHRRGERASLLGDGVLNVGGEARPKERLLKLEKGDTLILAVDARNNDHSCDLTELNLTIIDAEKPGNSWDLAADVSKSMHQGNPHADAKGNKDVWSFVKGPTRQANRKAGPMIPGDSLLGRWRETAMDPAKQKEAEALASQCQTLLAGQRPTNVNDPNRILYDNLVTIESSLFSGLDVAKLGRPIKRQAKFGLDAGWFGKSPDSGKSLDAASFAVKGTSVTEIHLPASLFRDRDFVVDGSHLGAAGESVSQFRVLTTPPAGAIRWDGASPVVASAGSTAHQQFIAGINEFRQLFPTLICLHEIVPNDEVVTLKMYHREDEHLSRLMLNDSQQKRIDHLWKEHRHISQQPIAENKYLPLFIGFVTQDQPKELLNYFEGQRENFRKRAEDFEKEMVAAVPGQLDALVQFADKAYRRPLRESEKTELRNLYQTLRNKGVSHEEAFRGVLARILVSPAFLFRIERAPAGQKPGKVNDWELATRLSYFLTSAGPDEELRLLAGESKLQDPTVLDQQTRRLLKSNQIRSLAIEFGTQWIHVRGIDEIKEKSEKFFPNFDSQLKSAIYEESILFFQDLFQNDRSIEDVLNSNSTYLNELLAKHYGIPGVTGPEWRRVDGVQKYGRGGILGLASVLTKQAGASRTSPVLRGNWVVETILGEKLPRPPANVPSLPEEEGADKLTMRELVEKHTRIPECIVCHQRIDHFGFALEKYDPIGRRREKDLGGLAVDSRAKLKDGTEFEGIDGLRNYLMSKKKDVIVRLFCKKLLGYALGRSVTLSDSALIDEMVAQLNKNEGRLSAAVLTIVRSPQFRLIRGVDVVTHE